MSFNWYHIRAADFTPSTGGDQAPVITRDNYEAYFVMYVDDELNAMERRAVEQFIQQHPDLEEELVMLQQSVLRADEGIVFEEKESLFKHTNRDAINEQNCEEYFVLYGDDELTNEEKDKVELFVYKHPQHQADFELIQQVKLVPDNTLSFPDKAYLYRTEEDDARVMAFPWWRISAAAIALLTIGSLAWYASTHFITNKNVAVVLPKTTPTEKTQTPAVTDNKPVPEADVVKVPQHAPDSNTTQAAHPDQPVVTTARQKNISNSGNIQSPLYVKQESIQQQPEEDPAGENEKSLSARPVDVAVGNLYERPEVTTTVIKNATINRSIATNTASVQSEEEPSLSQMAVLTQPINKTPLRGFFRKVSRVVDKVTSPDDNGKGGIRIANLAFALK
jgi:hypothetical protein